MPAPPLAVVRRSQQPVDDSGKSIRQNGRFQTPRPPRRSAASRSGRKRHGESRCGDRPAGEGASPAASSVASTNESTGERGQSRRWTAGTAGRRIGRYAQCDRADSKSRPGGCFAWAVSAVMRHDRALFDPLRQRGDRCLAAASPWEAFSERHRHNSLPSRASSPRGRPAPPRGRCRPLCAYRRTLSRRRPPLGDLPAAEWHL